METYIQPKRFAFTRNSKIFVYHPLPKRDIESIVNEWKRQDDERKKKRIPLYRYSFIQKHRKQLEERRKIKKLLLSAKCKDIGEAKQWLAVLTKFPFDFRLPNLKIEEIRLLDKERYLCTEVLEWMFCAERLAYIQMINDHYYKKDHLKATHTENIFKSFRKRPINVELLQARMAKSNSLKCSQLRLFFEQKISMLFNPEDVKRIKDKTAREVPNIFINKIEKFVIELRERFLKDLPKKETRKKMFEITLIQEATKLAFHAIRGYIRFLQKEQNIVIIDSNLVGRRLFFPLEQLKEYFKEPVMLVSKIEWVRFSSTDVGHWMDLVGQIIMDQLNQEKLMSLPVLHQFTFFIHNEQIPDVATQEELLTLLGNFNKIQLRLERAPESIVHYLFTIRLKKVWQGIQLRLQKSRKQLVDRIKNDLTSQLVQLQSDFRKDVRTLSFRSINPAQMLENKAVVDYMLENEIPNHGNNLSSVYEKLLTITQYMPVDKSQEELLIRLSNTCRSLPRLIQQHQDFFQRRLGTFQLFVNKKQKVVQVCAQRLNERLKVLQAMATPQDSTAYLGELEELRPSVQKLLSDLNELNRFEKVIGVCQTDLPRHRQAAEHMMVMQDLFKSTISYYEVINDFFESHRTAINISNLSEFLVGLLKQLSDYERCLAGHRAARLFIVQIRNDIDAFKKNFTVMEIMCCPRLLDNHWRKMSDIMSFDMSIYSNSTVAVLCELGLDKYLSQLKPIVFAAEREARVIDHLDDVILHWTTAIFNIEKTKYWQLKQPTNLRLLLDDAVRDSGILRDIRDTEATPPHISENLNKWTKLVEQLLSILNLWHATWEDWLTVARLFERSKFSLEDQFKLFRKCAKYWKKLVENLIRDNSVLRILDLKHVKCWLRAITSDLSKIITDIQQLMIHFRTTCPRLSLISDHLLLALLSSKSPIEVISNNISLIFPHLRSIYFNIDHYLEIINQYGDKFTFDYITKENHQLMTAVELVRKIEIDFSAKISTIIISEQRVELSKLSNKMMRQITDELFSHKKRNKDELLLNYTDGQFILETASHQHSTTLLIEPVALDSDVKTIPKKICQEWADGMYIMLVGPISVSRAVINQITQKLFISTFFINSHDTLDEDIFARVVENSVRESILTVLENISQLSSSSLYTLFKTLRRKPGKMPFPRLILTSTETTNTSLIPMCISLHTVTRDTLPEEEKIEIQLFDEDEESLPEEAPILIPKKLLSQVEQFSDQLKEGKIVACVGPMAKSILRSSQGYVNQKLNWLYVDCLALRQSIRKGTGFASEYEGLLIDILLHNETTSEEERDGSQDFVIFYGHSSIWQLVPMLSSLLLRYDGNSIPKPYMTLGDGSTLHPNNNTQCILCVSDSEGVRLDMLQSYGIPYMICDENFKKSLYETYEEEWKNKFHAILKTTDDIETFEVIIRRIVSDIELSKEYADILMLLLNQEFSEIIPNTPEVQETMIISTISLVANFLSMYADLPKELNETITHRMKTAFPKNMVKLPKELTDWKLSNNDLTKLVRWQEEPFYRSSLEKEDRLSDLVIVWPTLDRMLHFGIRLLALGRNLIINGPAYSQKTTFVKMLKKQLEREPEVNISFLWLGYESRVGLEGVQRMFARIIEDVKQNEIKYVVVDRFSFAEPLLGILELFVDCGAYYQNGKQYTTNLKLKFILITQDEDWMNINQSHALRNTFSNLQMKPQSFDDNQLLVHHLVGWNLTQKSFSSEYQKLLDPIAYSTVFLATRAYVPYAVLSICIRIVKGLQFAFPDNSPDTTSFIRLWTHEVLRVIMDGLDQEDVRFLIDDIAEILQDKFNITEGELLKGFTNWEVEEHLLSDEQSIEKTPNSIDLASLLYSEMDVVESYDGLSYVPVKNMVNFNRTMENFLFEYHKNHTRDRIQLAIDSNISAYVQKVSRIIRQTGEHLCICGKPGQGRSQMVKLAAAANNSMLMHLYPDASSFEAFLRGWYNVFGRVINSIIATNQHVCILVHMDFNYARVEPRWIEYLRLWLERPETSRIITDEQLISAGELLIENEKSLAAQMQSIGLRLPGQRQCRFLAIEVLKEPSTLRHIIESRMDDLMHVIFLTDHDLKTDFSWCTVLCLRTPTEDTYDNVTVKMLTDAKVGSPLNRRMIRQIFRLGSELLNWKNERSWSRDEISKFNLYYHVLHHTTQLCERRQIEYSKKVKTMTDALTTLSQIRELQKTAESIDEEDLIKKINIKESDLNDTNGDIDTKSERLESLLKKTEEAEQIIDKKMALIGEIQEILNKDLKIPEDAYSKAVDVLTNFNSSDYRTFSHIPKPSIGCRLVAEVLQLLVGNEFKKKVSKDENWAQMQKMLRTPLIHQRVLKFEMGNVTEDKLQKIKKYVDSKEFRPVKMRTESALAAELSIWISALAKLASALRHLDEKRKELADANRTIQELQKEIVESKVFIVTLQDELTSLTETRIQIESELSNNRKLLAYRSRCGIMLERLQFLEKQWKDELSKVNHLNEDLFGNACLQSAYQIFAANESLPTKMRLVDEWQSYLKAEHFLKHHSFSCSNLALHFVRNLNINRKFAFFIDEKNILFSIILQLFPHSATIDVGDIKWTDNDLIERIIRHLSNATPIIFYNLQEVPPIAYYELLLKWEEREIRFFKHLLRLPNDFLLIFITQKHLEIPPQLQQLVDVYNLNEKLTFSGLRNESLSNHMLEILSQKSATDILESEENTIAILDTIELYLKNI